MPLTDPARASRWHSFPSVPKLGPMTKIDFSLDLPDSVARKAEAAGLLTPRALTRMLRDEVRRAAVRRIAEGVERVRAADISALSMAEIQREIRQVRKDA